ncbi:MAG: ribose 5-phosphate isomerase A [Actinomycetota bacterium]|nr:ribose 5-phosphate isomerase A [Actinomycetota bacterium]
MDAATIGSAATGSAATGSAATGSAATGSAAMGSAATGSAATGSAAMGSADREKRVAAEAAAELVEDGMSVGLGTGTTVAHLLPALARRGLDIRCVATSPHTAALARQVGLRIERFSTIDRLDVAVDGADQVAPDGWLVKGGGAAHTREKLVAAAADRFIVIVDSTKLVAVLTPPVPLELLGFGIASSLRRLGAIGPVRRRDGVARSPDGGVICDYLGDVVDPRSLAAALEAVPGVVEHGLFPPEMVAEIIVGRKGRARARHLRAPSSGRGK